MKNLEVLAVDRNRLETIPENIGNCKSLRVLLLRENDISLLPESLALCVKLTVLDIAENNILFLPGEFRDLELKAIWLSENQNQPLVKFHEEKIVFQGQSKDVLLCYMLPQKKKTQEVILRRSIIESDDGMNYIRRSQSNRVSVTFESDLPTRVSLEKIIFTWIFFQ